MTKHGAEIWAAFEQAGKESGKTADQIKALWDSRMVPVLKQAGSGPLYTMKQELWDQIIALAKS